MIITDLYGKKMGLVVIDAQRKFCNDRPDWSEKVDELVFRINRLMFMFRQAGRPVVVVQYEGVTHCRPYEGTDGDEYFRGLAVEPGDIVVTKHTMNSFKETDLEDVLRKLGYDMILLCGTVSQYCVMSTYFGALDREIIPYFAHDATISTADEITAASEIVCKTLEESTVAQHLGVPEIPEGDSPVWVDSTYPDWSERLICTVAALANGEGGHFMLGYPKGLKGPEATAGKAKSAIKEELGLDVSAEPIDFCSQDCVEVRVSKSGSPVVYHGNRFVPVRTYVV
ncbi:isochorismatase family protein Amidases nicotinamidase -like protein [Thermoplasmatales archaeon BRNA1]|nr:isochorismatase family protein Amidases nicotinamidase -like protein [Thermoplasmatales archaeon BRNA1]